jgi:hypothetical protein
MFAFTAAIIWDFWHPAEKNFKVGERQRLMTKIHKLSLTMIFGSKPPGVQKTVKGPRRSKHFK